MSPLTRIAPALVAAALAGALPARADGPAPSNDPVAAVAKAVRPHHVYLVGTLRISRPWIDLDHPGGDAPGYVLVENRGETEDRLTGASVSGADAVQLAQADGGSVNGLVVPPNGRLMLQPGGAHLAMQGIHDPPPRGTSIEGTLSFARSGTLHVSFSTDRAESDEDDQSAPSAADKPAQLK